VLAAIHCQACKRRIGRRGRHVVVAMSYVVCLQCALDPKVHDAEYFGCRGRGHTIADHQPPTVTRAGASWLLDIVDPGR
jgi:hypothetical protein